MATCPVCGSESCEVREQWAQATRHEARRSLGKHVWCPECQVSSPLELSEAVARVRERLAAAEGPVDRIVASNSEGVVAGLLALDLEPKPKVGDLSVVGTIGRSPSDGWSR